MKTNTFFNILSVAGLVAAAVICYLLYTRYTSGELTKVLLWGSLPILIFVVISSLVQLIRNRNRVRH